MKKSIIKKIIIVLFWLTVWQLGALWVGNKIVLAGPIEVIKCFITNLFLPEFYKIALFSLLRIGLGFFTALVAAVLLAFISYRFEIVHEFLLPVINAIKSVPVASFVVLLLLWTGSENLSFFISLLIVFPNIYINSYTGLKNTDPQLLEMADSFNASFFKKLIYIYRDSISPHLLSGIRVSVGMAWKSGVAAEVIGLPVHSLGERIYMSKIYLDTANLFAWTLLVIILCAIFEKVVVFISGKILTAPVTPKRIPQGNGGSANMHISQGNTASDDKHIPHENTSEKSAIHIENLTKQFDEKVLFENINISIEPGSITCLTGASGIGKTTLLKEIMSNTKGHSSFMFQEDRLLENADSFTNISLFAKGFTKEEILEAFNLLLPGEDIHKPVSTFSGGMKRRIALLRTLMCSREILLLDEPFTGLDSESRDMAISVITRYRRNRTLIFITHDTSDAAKLGATLWSPF